MNYRDDIMEDYEIGIALRKEMELRELSERYPAIDVELLTPWARPSVSASRISFGSVDKFYRA